MNSLICFSYILKPYYKLLFLDTQRILLIRCILQKTLDMHLKGANRLIIWWVDRGF
jgi:hypothetical protein